MKLITRINVRTLSVTEIPKEVVSTSLNSGGFGFAQPPGRRRLSGVEGSGVEGRGSLNNGGFDFAQPPGRRCLSGVEGSGVEGSGVEGNTIVFSYIKKNRGLYHLDKILDLVIRIGFEPMTRSLEGCCSIQLSYRTKTGCKDINSH